VPTEKKLLHTTITGTGSPIVLIHGFLSSSHYFKFIRKQLARTHQVITIDLLGFGKSPKPRLGYTFDDHLQAIRRTLHAHGVTAPFTLVGHSMGALISLRYATKYTDEIAALQLFNPPIFNSFSQMVSVHRTIGIHYRAMLYSRHKDEYWNALKLIPHNTTSARPPINFADKVRTSRHAREGSYKNIIAYGEFFSDLAKVAWPTLLVVGKYDRLVYQENLIEMKLPPHVTFELVEAGHHPLVKNVDMAERLIRSHLLQ
jgi:pimeloyl-ACP methyl ester carboxylesterase